MINSLLVYDNQDEDLGSFFQKCGEEVSKVCELNKNIEIQKISDGVVFSMLVPMRAGEINSKKFIFVSFTHGSETELLQNSDPFVSINDDKNCLRNSFAYCFACSAGKSLGANLIKEDTLSFIGYKSEISIQTLFNREDLFVECAVAGINAFVKGKTVKESFDITVAKYNTNIDKIYTEDMPTASLLMENRDGLILHGNQNLCIDDF